MSDDLSQLLEQMKIDRGNLYREETVTDLRAATIRQLVPILEDGSTDAGRARGFVGSTQIMSPRGPVPIQAEIPAANLGEAMEKFPAAMQQAVQDLVKQAEEYRRQEASRIVVRTQDRRKKGSAQGPGVNISLPARGPCPCLFSHKKQAFRPAAGNRRIPPYATV